MFKPNEIKEIVRQTALKICPSDGHHYVPAMDVASDADRIALDDIASTLEIMAQVFRSRGAELRNEAVTGGQTCPSCGGIGERSIHRGVPETCDVCFGTGHI